MTIADKLALLEQTKEAQRIKLGLPKSFPFSQYVKFMRDPFTPDEIFKNSEQGVWFDPSDLSTMFQDVDGIEPVAKDGDPVALIKDKSGNGNHATQETAISRPVYRTDGELHWLEFDRVDDSLDVNITATDNFDLSLSFNYLDNSTGTRRLITYNSGTTFIFGSSTNDYFNLFRAGSGTLKDTDRRNQGKKVITAYLSSTESSYIGQSGNLNDLSSISSRTINSITIGKDTIFDLYGFVFRDSSQFYPDISKQLHSYMQIKAGEWI